MTRIVVPDAARDLENLQKWAKFGSAVMADWPESYDLDALDLQELALEAGVLVPVAYDPEKHMDVFGLAPEPGDPWYERIPRPSDK